ncbi:metal transporter Nramp5-like [Zingiber officinale]|uniref:metal transporter Nramp5-like n=1 Tax=Zingiber officinale TaxID=94328 RepID=UPI001C4BF18D|nr:metal transporter Nramp5-like [Zingiber officinale]
MASSTVVGFMGLDELSLEIASLLVKSSYFMVSDGRVVSDEQVRGVGRSEVRKRYGSCNGYITSSFIEETIVLKRDIIAVIQRFNIQVSNLTQDCLGKSSSTVYAIALLASGQSSAITGFSKHEDEKMAEESHDSINRNHSKSHRVHHQWFLRSRTAHHNLIGTIDIPFPNFIILMVLSFELPFALLPLLKFNSSQTKMGPHKSSIYIIVVSWIIGLLLVTINIYFLSTSFVSWLIDSSLPTVDNVLISIIVFPLMAVYILAVIYSTFKETKVTFVDPFNSSHVNIESGGSFQVDGMSRSEVAPVREDRADIPLPD